ncbi:MAG: type I restriction-modification system subunit M [Caldilineaceae bacterium SB0664_bin_22]|nr:type I restriction-modification system subunit M [Caldilineaceae bacterium SB0664_bin_22]
MALRKSHFYASLWQSCDQLRGGMDASQYKDYVLTLVFMKYVSDKYAGTDDPFPDITVPPGGSFADMVSLKDSKEIGDGINIVIRKLADANDYLLKGVIDQADFNDESKLGKGKEMTDRLTELVGIFEQLDFRTNRAQGDDLLGDAYEYLMRHFATQSGKSKGQFYTPAEVSRIMAQVIGIGPGTTLDRTVYDPTCGSGSLLIKAADEAPNGLTIYGQEMDIATWTMARMNMILHGQTTAEILHGNTLAAPSFTKGLGQLRRFDFAVANPPFSTKAWSNGLDPAHDEFRRFDYGIPPAKNGDYAFLLHLITSLKSTGKGAIILPHGILFRGNREANIRRGLVRRRLIRGIIGLPANLFYGTGIPACIVVIDKEDAATRDGIFMIDASRGFLKDGAKNRLRERDIHRIVDIFNEQKETPGYARMVPLTEIASATNDYNLNIPRYIDSSEPEDLHDLEAHLHGGIPNADIDALWHYWKVFPTLRQQLFVPGMQERYSDAQIEADEVRTVILAHEEFSVYRERVRGTLTDWRQEHAFQLYELGVGDSPKALIRDLSESLLSCFNGLPLLDHYDVYQCLMDYWNEVMQDDVYLVVTEGWEAGRQVRGADNREVPDFWLKKGRKTIKYVGVLVPASLVIERFFAKEKALADSIESSLMVVVERKSEFEEEHSGSGGALSDLEGQRGITKGNIQGRVVELKNVALQIYGHGTSEYKQAKKIRKTTFGDHRWDTGIVDSEGLFAELDVLYTWMQFSEKETTLRRRHKCATDDLYAKVKAKYGELTEDEIRTLVVGDKWMASIEDAIGQQVKSIIEELVDRVRVLEARYAETLPELMESLEELEVRVKSHLRDMQVRA